MPCVGRRFKPLPNETLVLKSRTYTIRPHPMAPNMPFAAEGRRAVVFNLQDGAGAKWALKVFKSKYRVSSLVDSAALVGNYQHLAGMIAARRTVIAPGDEAAVECPDLAYSTLMPWIEGNTWYDLLLNPAKFRSQYDHGASLRICGTFLKVMEGLEHAGITHTDIAPGNVMLNLTTINVQLVGLEHIYVPGIPEPEIKNMGSSGYQHPKAEAGKGNWCADGDRYATAVMAAEMLLFANPDTESFSSDSGLFGGDRNTSTGTQRFNATFPYLQSVAPHFAELFRTAWMSETLDACPLASELSLAIAKVPLPPTFRWELLGQGPRGHTTQPSCVAVPMTPPSPRKPTPPIVDQSGLSGSSTPEQARIDGSPYRIAIGHPHSLPKGISSRILVILHHPNAFKKTKRILDLDFKSTSKRTAGYKLCKDQTDLQEQTRVQIELVSQAIDFSSPVTLELSGSTCCARFVARPREDSLVLNQTIKVLIRETESGGERYSGFIQMKITDYVFDHISRPVFSRCMSAILAVGSLITFFLTNWGKLSHAFGLTTSATAFVLGSGLFGISLRDLVFQKRSSPIRSNG